MWYLLCDVPDWFDEWINYDNVPLVQAFAAAIRFSSSSVEAIRDGRLVARSATYGGV